MYILNYEKIVGNIKIRSMSGEMKKVKRKTLMDFLEGEKEKEKDSIRKQDYQILISSIMGIESLILENKRIQIVFDQELRWRGESEAEIIENDKMIQNLKKFYKKLKKTTELEVMGTLF